MKSFILVFVMEDESTVGFFSLDLLVLWGHDKETGVKGFLLQYLEPAEHDGIFSTELEVAHRFLG